MGKNIGYARVSTAEQNLALQLEQLKAVGCEQIFSDKASGSKHERPGLTECLNTLQQGDTLIVWRLDRLGRSIVHLITVITELKDRGIHFKSLHDGAIDTSTASGELVFNIFSALAQFERALIRERTQAGLASARARGHIGGRKPVFSTTPKVRIAQKMYQDKAMGIKEICNTLGISRATLYRYLAIG